MKKIDRRDYILKMGAGAAGLIAGSPVSVLADSLAPPQTTNLLWKATTTLPSNPRVTVIFGGLFAFFYNTRSGDCEIGAHKDGKHRLMIEVWERNNGLCGTRPLFSTENGSLPTPTGTLQIQIEGKPMGEADFYQVGDYDLQRRKLLRAQDFRWLPDLDSNDFYPENYDKFNDHIKHKIVVKHGTFYTYQRTESTFERIDPPESPTPNKVDFYHVANYMAAGIKPNDNEDVLFRVANNSWLVIRNRPGFTYEIHIFNHCYKNDHEYCDFSPKDPMEINRNHFHHMRKMLRLPQPPAAKHYGLLLKDKGYSSRTFCPEASDKGTDEAPCMGAGFGKTNGMP